MQHAATALHQRTNITCGPGPSCLGSLDAQPLSQSLEVCGVIMATASCQGAPNQLHPSAAATVQGAVVMLDQPNAQPFLLQQSVDHTALLRPAKPSSSAAAAA